MGQFLTEDARSLMPDIQLGTLFAVCLTFFKKNNTLSLSTFRRHLKHFYFSHY